MSDEWGALLSGLACSVTRAFWFKSRARRRGAVVDDRQLAAVDRMYREACSRIDDANLLASHWPASSYNSDYLLRVLGLEVLLKATLKLFGVSYPDKGRAGHRYVSLWNRLPRDAQREAISVARERMQGVGGEDYKALDLSNGRNIDRALNHAEEFFIKARYQYEYFENFTQQEQRAVEQRWIERGAPDSEADIVTRGPEVGALIEGLRAVIKARLPEPSSGSGEP